MANVALIAPLAGPLAGAALMELAPWRTSFLLIAVLSFLALLGLLWKMPETTQPSHEKLPLARMGRDYLKVFGNGRFVLSALCIPLLALPLMGWIAMSPVLLVHDLHMSALEYGLMQLPVFGGLIAGNLALVLVAGRWPLGRSALIGMWPIVLGLSLMLSGVLWSAHPQYFMVAGMTLMAFGEGLAFGVLYRFALMSCDSAGKGTVSASMSMLSMAGYALGVEMFRIAYQQAGMLGFACLSLAFSWPMCKWRAAPCAGRCWSARSRRKPSKRSWPARVLDPGARCADKARPADAAGLCHDGRGFPDIRRDRRGRLPL